MSWPTPGPKRNWVGIDRSSSGKFSATWLKALFAGAGWLKKNGLLTESVCDLTSIRLNDNGVEYGGIQYRSIIFCDGKTSAQNPFFDKLPFALNKGEGLLVEIQGLRENLVFKKGMTLVPFKDKIYWLGSSYEWSYHDEQPSVLFRKTAEAWLNNNLKLPYSILEYFAAIRPATLERRPFVGFHPSYKQIGILNGFGTKGCSLAPFFAKELVQKIKGERNINPLADINRFEKIMNRK